MRRGFTLVELLVSVAIFAVLTAILVPVLGSAKRRSQAAVAVAHVRQYAQAALIYESAYEGLPEANNLTGGYWISAMGLMRAGRAQLVDPTFRVPDPKSNLVALSGYAINGCLGSRPFADEPSRTVIFATVGEFADINVLGVSEMNVVALMAPDSIEYGEIGDKEFSKTNQRLIRRQEYGALRHMGKGAYSFLDGHAKLHAPTEFTYPTDAYMCFPRPGSRMAGPNGGLRFFTTYNLSARGDSAPEPHGAMNR
ncbi:MAG: prepilin-type N-terminal cleavage/methylation domain-containing protein [Fimbriimonadaceae bacterium]|nr:prepilin-type N-terminal cleavage/methylation domain-containing protein [Fimbriimonadaceae bacterium]